MTKSNLPRAILSVDPGGNVGFAVREPHVDLRAWIVKLGPWTDNEEPPKAAALEVVDIFCREWEPSVKFGPRGVVLCEQFTTAQRQNRYGRFTNELIGAVEGICFVYGVPFIRRVNKERKKFTPQAERLLGVPHNPKPHHDRDDVAALSHLLAFIAMVQGNHAKT